MLPQASQVVACWPCGTVCNTPAPADLTQQHESCSSRQPAMQTALASTDAPPQPVLLSPTVSEVEQLFAYYKAPFQSQQELGSSKPSEWSDHEKQVLLHVQSSSMAAWFDELLHLLPPNCAHQIECMTLDSGTESALPPGRLACRRWPPCLT